MTLATVETSLLTILREVTDYNANNTSIGDERVLARGGQAAVIRYGGVRPLPDSSLNRWAFIWTLLIDMWFPNRGEISFYNTDISTKVQDVMTRVLGYPKLNGNTGVTHVTLLDASDPARWQGDRGSSNYWVVTLVFAVTEKQVIPLLESG